MRIVDFVKDKIQEKKLDLSEKYEYIKEYGLVPILRKLHREPEIELEKIGLPELELETTELESEPEIEKPETPEHLKFMKEGV